MPTDTELTEMVGWNSLNAEERDQVIFTDLVIERVVKSYSVEEREKVRCEETAKAYIEFRRKFGRNYIGWYNRHSRIDQDIA